MTKYEARSLADEERVSTITISGITLTITKYAGGAIGIETSQTLTDNQETNLRSTLDSKGFKLIWKDGVVL